ncbi:MAG TPA: YdaS family helix-turn-helix protein [Mizugakiibacter sp.]
MLLEVKRILGSFAAIARVCRVTRQAVSQWQCIDPEYAPALEVACKRQVTAEQMCPQVEWERDPQGRIVCYRTPVRLQDEAA